MDSISPGTIAFLCGFAGGIILGFAARWGRFCTLGAIEDVTFGVSSTRLRMWGLAIAVAIAGTYTLNAFQYIDVNESFYISTPTTLLATAFGAVLFGLGMALVGTCGFGMLSRVGGGDLKSVVTFLVMGISAYATVGGLTAYIRVAVFPTPDAPENSASFSQFISEISPLSVNQSAFIIAILIAVVALFRSSLLRDRKKLFTAILVGATIVWGWYATGYLALDDFDPYPLESFTFTAPLGETIMYAMTATGASLNFGIGATLGIITGAAVTSLIQGHFRWEACDDSRELRRQIFGGFLMGFGGVIALGCTIGQGLSAASLLAYSAPVSLLAMFAGAWIGLQWLVAGTLPEMFSGFFHRQTK